MSLQIRDEVYDSPNARRLIVALQAEYVERYGGPDETPVDREQFAPPDGRFVIGYLDRQPVAMGGVRLRPDEEADQREVEIKRMYVVPSARRRGFARLVLSALEDRARELGATRVVLETGQKQPEAVSLYESAGYQPIDGFGHYRCMPLSLSYAKTL